MSKRHYTEAAEDHFDFGVRTYHHQQCGPRLVSVPGSDVCDVYCMPSLNAGHFVHTLELLALTFKCMNVILFV